jgi:hypothetical protein
MFVVGVWFVQMFSIVADRKDSFANNSDFVIHTSDDALQDRVRYYRIDACCVGYCRSDESWVDF